MIKAGLPKSYRSALIYAGRRLCHTLARPAAALNAEAAEEARAKPATPFQARLWAMERVSKHRKHLVSSLKAWRIPACLDRFMEGLPEGIGFLVYLDRLQVHQFYWKLGNPRFLCTKFQLDLHDRTWEDNFNESKIIATVEVYPHMVNLNKEDDIINLTFVNPQHWGKRCPILFSGEQHCIGLKKGGVMKRDLTYLAFQCEHDLNVPDITVDVSNLDIGEEIVIKDLNLRLDLTSNLKPSTVICKVLAGQ